ncbi:hypothetical protein GOBAR_AA37734 [Gossypium barbadense]|uniref:PPM-type phosphatase domain-containing protein n=3 Tax=Gossypium TaxID=3633 RepID=A0A2P5VW04_GOSBA|nr:probable protein phosphatase 2C 11 isoform X6 [Gossypium hirsutum]PPR82979.1 hypothetical protein GOBAR_AA37734 [Gossypium barbadense]TYI23316.1 hypothetical protein ES332_A06G156700v1 [Gossypium tomentosum]TYI23318.1 hypothetical protein ES332_A06G156700v1 [Gossypium tomentosum]
MLWRLEMALWGKNADSRHASKNQDKISGDAEFKQNKTLPAEKQIVTANPEINAVELCDDDEFLVLALRWDLESYFIGTGIHLSVLL